MEENINENVSNTKQRNSKKLILRKAKNVAKFTLASTGMVASTLGLASGSPAIAIASAALLTTSALNVTNAAKGTYIKNSMMQATNKGKIQQMTPNIEQIIQLMCLKDKQEFLNMQELNFFLGSDVTDAKGKQIVYTTRSHALTYRNLSALQRKGYIEGLAKRNGGKSKLIIEKILLGNLKLKDLNKISDNSMYNISFVKTDKVLTEKGVKNIFHISDEDWNEKYVVKKDEKGNICNVGYNTHFLIEQKWGSVKDRVKYLKEKLAKDKKESFFTELQSSIKTSEEFIEEYTDKIGREKNKTLDDVFAK